MEQRGEVIGMIHGMKLNKVPFLMIECGEKIYELRLWDEKRQLLSVGDKIVFTMADDAARKMTVDVVALHRFASFDELYRALPLDLCGYRKDELESASPFDMEAYYSKETQSQYGVVAIEVKVLT